MANMCRVCGNLDILLKEQNIGPETFLVIGMSFNKDNYVLEMVDSVLNQSYKDFVFLLIESSTNNTKQKIRDHIGANAVDINFDVSDRAIIYNNKMENMLKLSGVWPPSFFINLFLSYLKDYFPYFAFIADDDLLASDFLQAHYENFKDAQKIISMNNMLRLEERDTWFETGKIIENEIIDICPADGTNVDCRVDGSQVAYRFSALESIDKPYFELSPTIDIASHADGIFLTKLNRKYKFYPVASNECLSVHRTTKQSLYTRAGDISKDEVAI